MAAHPNIPEPTKARAIRVIITSKPAPDNRLIIAMDNVIVRHSRYTVRAIELNADIHFSLFQLFLARGTLSVAVSAQ
jgi:hypothetical protein